MIDEQNSSKVQQFNKYLSDDCHGSSLCGCLMLSKVGLVFNPGPYSRKVRVKSSAQINTIRSMFIPVLSCTNTVIVLRGIFICMQCLLRHRD